MIYHILNGDSTLTIWNKNSFEGTPIVFREMLVEGNVSQQLLSEDFFDDRRHFFEFNYSMTSEDYEEISYNELIKLKSLKDIEEIVLWFENDLFCQVNLMALISFLATLNSLEGKISLVKAEKNKGLGEYKIEAYPKLYENRIKLAEKDIDYGVKFWEKYTDQKLEGFLPFLKQYSSSFSYVEEAVQAHIERFPSPISGINKIERRILKYLNDEPLTMHQLIGKLLRRQTWEGFGDLQYEKMINDLSPNLIKKEDEKFQLTLIGMQVLRGTLKYDDSNLSSIYLGGVMRTDYFFDPINNLVIERK